MFIMGSLYAAGAVHAESGAARWVVIVMIYLFTLVFSGTWGVSFRVYVSEIQSPQTRAGAASLALSANWVRISPSFSSFIICSRRGMQVVNWIIAFTTPIFLAHSTYGIYFFFGTAALLTVVVCALFMPETRGKSLEDIDASFRRHQAPMSRVSGVFGLRSTENSDSQSNVEVSRFTTSSKA
jgi:hypothetical protein